MKTLPYPAAVLLAAALAFRAAAAPPAPVTALAYRPDGKQLAAGVRGEVVLIDATGAVTGRIPGQTGPVTAAAWSRDGVWFAVASGVVGKSGEVRLYAFPPKGRTSTNPEKTIAAHADRIHDLAFSPDGKTLATCGYDRLVKLWDVATGNEVRALKDHSDSVYGVGFRPDGKLLASGAADRAVKVWDPATGVRLYSLGDPTDWVYAVAWHPDGKRLAAAGVDKSVRVWEADEKEGRLLKSAFAHEKPVLRLAYSADGKTLFSVSEDRTVKSWNADTLTEKKTYPAQSESVLAFALRPDGKQFALGRYDGALVLIDADTGKVAAQPLPEKPKPPKVTRINPDAGPRGTAVTITFEGEHLDDIDELDSTPPGLQTKCGITDQTRHRKVEVKIAADATPGVYQLKFRSAAGESNPVTFHVDRFAARPEPAGSDSPRTAPVVGAKTTVVGKLDRAGDVDYFRFELKAGQELGVQVQPTTGGKLEPVLAIEDSSGRILSETTNGLLGFRSSWKETYVLAVRDREYRGGGEFSYRLHVGDIPIVSSVFPLGFQRGTEAEIRVAGVYLGSVRSVKMKAPADAAPGTKIPVVVTTPNGNPLGGPTVVIGEFPEVTNPSGKAPTGHMTTDGKHVLLPEGHEVLDLPVPGVGNGWLAHTDTPQTWRFPAKKGQPLIVEVEARRLGSPLDSMIDILDDKGHPVPLAVLRCVARTVVTFRDHDSAGAGIRMDAWNEFAIDDHVLVGHELMRIKALPKNPDDDCQFYTVNGQRAGYLGTTPTHHALGTNMFKVSIHPPGSTFPPNGMPVFPMVYRNDDGAGKDSRLRFDPPADGTYRVRVTDARGHGGPEFAYRLTVRPPRPSFAVRFNPTAPAVWRGGAVPVTVTADRFDDFDGPIPVKLENLPPGFSAPVTFIEAGQISTTFSLFADEKAVNPDAKHPPLKLVATAEIDGKPVTREAVGGLPKVVDPGDIVTTVSQHTVAVRPGQQSRLMVHVERRNGFKGRIPIEVQGLPHGVRVLDIGLNGILVTERDTAREIVIYAEPWVKPMDHPFVVLAKREGKNTDHAARSVLLKVEK